MDGDFEDTEVIETSRALRSAGAKVVLVGSEQGKSYRGRWGKAIARVDVTPKDLDDDFDAAVIPGGYAPDSMRLDKSMIQFVKTAMLSGRIVAAICHGPQLLISAGVLNGRRVTSSPSIAVDLKNAGAIWIDAPVIIDGNLITSRKPADLPRFNKAIVEALRSSERCRA